MNEELSFKKPGRLGGDKTLNKSPQPYSSLYRFPAIFLIYFVFVIGGTIYSFQAFLNFTLAWTFVAFLALPILQSFIPRSTGAPLGDKTEADSYKK